MAVHQDILDWATELPAWQQDALRRLAESDQLTLADIKELAVLLKAEEGISLPEGAALRARPLAIPEPTEVASQDSVALLGLQDLKNINALADDQPVPFAPAGITVVFGDNGSGKTGFGRLLRTLCWARKRPDTILTNLDTQDTQAQQAAVLYRIGDQEQPAYTWTPDGSPPPELSRISVYDVDCGAVYVDEEQQSAYTPFGLDYFPKLARTCDQVRDEVRAELASIERDRPEWPGALAGTAVGGLLQQLASAGAKSQLDRILPLNAGEEQAFEILSKTLDDLKRDNPEKQAAFLRNAVQRLRTAQRRIETVTEGLSGRAADDLKTAIGNASIKAMAAQAASDKALGNGVLAGTGGPVWEELWNAARKFSETAAYPDRAFPAGDHGERCVLCQQELGREASQRLKSFDEFVRDEAAKQAQKATADVENMKRAVGGVECVWPDGDDVRSDLELREEGLGATFAACLESARLRQQFLREAGSATDWTSLPDLSPSPADRINDLAEAADAHARAIDASAKAKEKQEHEQELAELSARKWLAENKALIEKEAARLGLVARLQSAESATNTTKITTTGNTLTEKHVTAVHKDRFTDELRRLRVDHLGVELNVKRGTKGSTLHQLVLTRSPGHPVGSVLSSGERNVVGLAAFFAELDPERGDAIIFDDPVSSLDQDKREDVAHRLVQEAGRRQVIIWTHDLSFLGALKDWRDKLKSPDFNVLTVSSLDGTAGIVEHELPWLVMKVKDRIGVLEKALEELRKLAQGKNTQGYAEKGRLFYGHLRDTWERATEEVLFRDVVQRWRKSIQTQMLREVADNVTRDDFETITNGMTHCGTYAHDQTTQTPPPVPRTDQMETDLNTLREWVDGKRKPPNAGSAEKHTAKVDAA